MDVQQAQTLAKNYPDVFLALLKRMSQPERIAVLKEFENAHPKDFKVWYTADVKAYLESFIK